ncbi:MAG: hypothetical protein ACK5XF_09240 [Neisseriaceae bacterium]
MYNAPIFNSFFQGGFECSTHRRHDGIRLDLIASTKHDTYALHDYITLARHGIHTIRDGIRWHLIEQTPRYYDWSSFLPMLKAAQVCGMQVIWDLCHYGYPDELDIWKPEFVNRFASFAKALAKLVKSETDTIPFYTTINEISFWSWAGGDVGYFNPLANNRGFELKHQLIRASIAAIEAILDIEPRARFVQAEPLINIINPNDPNCEMAKRACEAQYQAFDMLIGDLWPGAGGHSGLLDIIGVNYYSHNQTIHNGSLITVDHELYQPFSKLLSQLYLRYKRPILITETGAESNQRCDWLSYICDEVSIAMTQGVPIQGICIYPITNYQGWLDGRNCETGLLGNINTQNAKRNIYKPLANLLSMQQERFNNMAILSAHANSLSQNDSNLKETNWAF